MAGSETNQLSQVFLLTTVHTTCCHSFSSHESFIGGLVGVAWIRNKPAQSGLPAHHSPHYMLSFFLVS